MIELDEAIREGLQHVGVEETAYVCDRLIPIEQLLRKGDPDPTRPAAVSGCDSGHCFL